MLKMLQKFLKDQEAETMYITGQAGTGKTTGLRELVEWCQDTNTSYQVCAYTHNACDILRSKLPQDAEIATLHSFLQKRPTINVEANQLCKVEGNSSASKDFVEIELLIIDEFSMIGEKDVLDIQDLQYCIEMEDDLPYMKVLYIGDPNQLPPVRDLPSIVPTEPYWYELTKIWRQAKDNPLITPLTQLVKFINGEPPSPLVTSNKFIRDDPKLLDTYKNEKNDKVLLAYTNAKVQHLNFTIMGREEPEPGDKLFSPTLHKSFTFNAIVPPMFVTDIRIHQGKTLSLGAKYKPLEMLIKSNLCEFYELEDEAGVIAVYAVVFGTKNYCNRKDELGEAAVESNKVIEAEFNVKKAASWARENWQNPLAKKRGHAWSSYINMKSNVMSMDFAHAMTIHKSQGMTVDTVFLDAMDLHQCLRRDYTLYCKLFYVALSRASNKVITN